MSTGESWHELMYDAGRMRSITYECDYVLPYSKIAKGEITQCGNPIAQPYFLSFMILVSFIFLNLFIAIIIDRYNISQKSEELPIGEATIEDF
jgi:hypothetical protein